MYERITYEINGDKFRSQKELKDFIIDFIAEYQDCVITEDKDKDAFFFVYELLKLHPNFEEKTKNGIKSFVVKKDGFGKNYCIFIRDNYKRMIDFSWRACVRGKPQSVDSNLKAAMREAISEDIISFKRSRLKDDSVCDICSCQLTEGDIHVDHVNHFILLADEFKLLFDGVLPREFDDCLKTFRAKFKETDSDFKSAWVDYHNKNAELRLVCSRCNLTRAKGALND